MHWNVRPFFLDQAANVLDETVQPSMQPAAALGFRPMERQISCLLWSGSREACGLIARTSTKPGCQPDEQVAFRVPDAASTARHEISRTDTALAVSFECRG